MENALSERARQLNLAEAKERRLLERERRLAEKDALVAERTRRKWAAEDRRRDAEEKTKEAERLRIAIGLAKKAGLSGEAEYLLRERIHVISGRRALEGFDASKSEARTRQGFRLWRRTKEIADDLGVPWQTISRISRGLGLKESPHAREAYVEVSGEMRSTVEYSGKAREIIADQVRMEQDDRQLTMLDSHGGGEA